MSNKTALIILTAFLAFVGGTLLIQSGFRTPSFLLTLLSYSEKQSFVPPEVTAVLNIAAPILSAIISLGGLLVILGGLLVIVRHRTVASVLIALGGGFGIIGLFLALGYGVFTSGLSIILTHVDYWIGVLFATAAREILKRIK